MGGSLKKISVRKIKIMDRILKNKGTAISINKMALGKLVVADAKASFENLDNLEFLKTAMLKAAEAGKLNVLSVDVHRFEPHGVSAVLVLQESHFSVHTWPEYGYLAVDIFACGEEGDPEKAMEKFLEIMEAYEQEVEIFERGILGNTQ